MSTQIRARKARLIGIMTTAELRSAGKSATQVRTLTRQGTLVRLGFGVYADGAAAKKVAASQQGRHLLKAAAVLAAEGADGVASHQTAALVYGIELLDRPKDTVTLTRPPGRNRAGRAGVLIHSAHLPPGQISLELQIPVTSAARTVVDLARSLEFRAGVVSADSALHHKLVTKPDLLSVLGMCRKWPGAGKAAEVVAFADELSESVLESLARVVFKETGLPSPELQKWVGGVEVVGRVDFLWRQYRTVAEVDGQLKYADPNRAILQLRRDKLLRDAGYEVVHFSWADITENPGLVATALRTAFARGTVSHLARV
jgi:Transcriptional regulator, AbiEi antitoxin/Protein of unknown function (DUF559)